MADLARRHRPAVLGLAMAAIGLASGCTIAPKSFLRNRDPAPVVRARSLGMGRDLPESYVVPTLIAKLNDEDAVVRMTAHEELKRRTGRDFRYLPWAGPADRTPAVTAWRNWWDARRSELARRSPNLEARSAARPIVQTAPPTRRERRAASRGRFFNRR